MPGCPSGQLGDSERMASAVVAETPDVDIRALAGDFASSPGETARVTRAVPLGAGGGGGVEILLGMLTEAASIALAGGRLGRAGPDAADSRGSSAGTA